MILHPLTKKPLKWVFFDLDNTLWDFDGNAHAALKVLFERHQLAYHTGYQVEQFIHIKSMILHPLTKKPLKWVFFDLDNTLWDFDGNAHAALKVLFERHQDRKSVV